MTRISFNKPVIMIILAILSAMIMVLLLIVPSVRVHAGSSQPGPVYEVNNNADSNDGDCSEVNCTLREAIIEANLQAGANGITFSIADTITLGSTLPAITSTVIITGPVSGISISGNNSVQILKVNTNGTLTLKDLTIAIGQSPSGAGIHNQGTVVINHCDFTGNWANAYQSYGGAIYNDGGTLTILNSSFNKNHSSSVWSYGGALYNSGKLTVSNSAFSQNTTNAGSDALGGGIYNYTTGVATIENSEIYSNTSLDDGGGIYNAGKLTISNTRIYSNTADMGGGIFNNVGAAITVTNSTIHDNLAINGAGIYNKARLNLFQSTLNANSASIGGGGLTNDNSGKVLVKNTTFYHNTAGSIGGAVCNASGIITLTNSTFSSNGAYLAGGLTAADIHNVQNGMSKQSWLKNTITANQISGVDCLNYDGILGGGSDNLATGVVCPGIDKNPKLGPLQDNGGPTWTMALLPGSPAVNAANDTYCTPTDQRGVTRPQGSHCDIGAYEAIFIYLPLVTR